MFFTQIFEFQKLLLLYALRNVWVVTEQVWFFEALPWPAAGFVVVMDQTQALLGLGLVMCQCLASMQ